MRIVVCGECFSPNLGDGIIALGIERCIRSASPDATMEFVDLSGRSGFAADGVAQTERSALRTLHQSIYRHSYFYAAAANVLKSRLNAAARRNVPLADDVLSDTDRVIIGGGQIVQDNRLTFPLALFDAVRSAERNRVPVSFFSVGVGGTWSAVGRRLMRSALLPDVVEHIVCRDSLSAERLAVEFPEAAHKATVSCDAALALAQTPPAERHRSGPAGLCIMHPATVRWTEAGSAFGDARDALDFWVAVCRLLALDGVTVRLFTNGAFEDQTFAERILARLQQDDPMTDPGILLPRPATPADLIQMIGGFGCIVANRLHANIVATVKRVPCVALGWDDKVEEFMRYSGQSPWFLTADAGPSAAASLAIESLRSPDRPVPFDRLIESLDLAMSRVIAAAPGERARRSDRPSADGAAR